MARAMGAALRLLLRLCACAFFLASCHALVGDYEVTSGTGPDVSPITGACRPGEWTCNREFLLQCTKDGVWKTDQTCQTASQCDKTAKTCTVCAKAGVRRCNGAQREFCNNNRSGWNAIETCSAAEECSPTHCGPCIAGEVQCSGPTSQDLQVCNANGRWQQVATCDTPTLCERSASMAMADPTWTPQCLTPSCSAGTLKCEGSTLYRCRQSQDGYDRIDICASPALCQLAAESDGTGESMCPTGCTPAGSFRCTDNAVEQCSSDQTGWSDPEPCPANTVCDSETGECGAPCELGMKRCNAGTLEACTAERMWAVEQTCATVALCDKAPADGSAPRCNPPVCAPQETRCTGATLEICNDDRTGFVMLTTCASPELCACTKDGSACTGGIDANGCGVPVCMPLDSGEMPLRCNPGNPLQVDICDASLNGWNELALCGAGEFCYTADRNAPCQVECPAPLLCNGSELLSCTVKGPPVHQADCATPTLCECAVAGSCSTFPNGCGIPQCGGTLPEHRCDASVLQTCQVGRAGWDDKDCGDGALCYPGEPPGFTGGYCAVCPTAGVVECNDDASGIRTCAPDRLGYVSETPCALGCLERPGPSADYCAVCDEGELRCNGTEPGLSRVRECNEDQAGFTDVGAVCEHGCLDVGLADQCAACQPNEKRCMGNQLMACNASRTALTVQETCGQACINSGIADYCGMCAPGNTQCDGDLLQTCQANGSLNAGTTCPNGCVTSSPTQAVCAPTCRPGTYRCASSTMPAAPDGAQLQQCNATGTGWTLVQTCGSAALCDEQNQECDDCTSGQYNCNAGTLRSCNASGKWATTGGQNCFGNSLYTCSGNTLTGPTTCTICDDTANECDDCVQATTPYSCSGGTLRSCTTDGHWMPTTANCSGTTLRVCAGTGGNTVMASTCTICDDAQNQCDICNPSSFQCSGGSLQVCDTAGQAWEAAKACIGSTLRTCMGMSSTPTQSTCVAPASCNAAMDACSMCTDGDRRCLTPGGPTRQTCTGGVWVNDTPACANGCFGTEPNADCGVCASGAKRCLNDLQPQTCTMGQWTNMGSACSGAKPVCVASTGTCEACTNTDPGSCTGATPVCSNNACVACTDDDAGSCDGATPACFNNQCVACTTDANCLNGQVCHTASHTCVDCTGPAQCPGEHCDTTTNKCVECLTNADCMPEFDVCNMGVCEAAE